MKKAKINVVFRNRLTGRDEFIFYSKRLMRILIEYALSLLPFEVEKNNKYEK